MEFMTGFGIVLFLAWVFCFVMIIRNQIVYNTRIWLINSWSTHSTDDPYYRAHDSVSYHAMMWNFKCWTRKQFFPELIKENQK